MIFKGFHMRKTNHIVTLPEGSYMVGSDKEDKFYAQFGRVVPRGKKRPANAVKTTWTWVAGLQDNIWAVPVTSKGHSRTNMAYCKDRRGTVAIALIKGRVYQARVSYNPPPPDPNLTRRRELVEACR